MKTEQELKQYVSDFLEAHGQPPRVEFMRSGMVVQNAMNTSHLHPWKWGTSGSWIDYWRAFANYPFIAAPPSFCSASRQYQNDIFNTIEILHHDDNIVGAHVYIHDGEQWLPGAYIAPICGMCNGKDGKKMLLRIGTPMVKMECPIDDRTGGFPVFGKGF